MNTKIFKKIFDTLQNENYCIIKLEENTFDKKGGDVDLYCEDISKVGKKILHIGNSLLNSVVYDSIKLTENKELKQIHIDFYKNNQLDFRFDILGKFPYLKTVEVKREIFNHCLKNKIQKIIGEGNNKYSVFVPEEKFDLLLRYIEYIEYYPERQEKIKHLEYIAGRLADSEKRFAFLSLLTTYILKRKPKNDHWILKIYFLESFCKRILRKIKSTVLNYSNNKY